MGIALSPLTVIVSMTPAEASVENVTVIMAADTETEGDVMSPAAALMVGGVPPPSNSKPDGRETGNPTEVQEHSTEYVEVFR